MSKQSFTTDVVPNGRSGILIRVPFDPNATWGRKTVHHVSAKIGPCDARGPLAKGDEGFGFRLGPAWV